VANAGETRCVLCGGQERSTVFTENDVDIVRCRTCGHVYSTFVTDVRHDAYWGEHNLDENVRFYWDHAHALMYDAFRNRFLEGRSGKLLDLGCGLGFFVRRLQGIDGWEAVGWEISPLAARYGTEELAKKYVPKLTTAEYLGGFAIDDDLDQFGIEVPFCVTACHCLGSLKVLNMLELQVFRLSCRETLGFIQF